MTTWQFSRRGVISFSILEGIEPFPGSLHARRDWLLRMTSGVRAARCLRRCFGSEWGSVETTPQRPKILKPPPNHPPQNKPSNRNRASASLARTDFQSRPQPQFMFRAWTLQHPALRSSATHSRRQPHARDQNDCEPAVDLLSSSPSRVYIAVVLLRVPALLAPFWPQAGLSTACDVHHEVAAVDNQFMRVCCGAIPCSCLEKGQGTSRNTAPFLLHLNVPVRHRDWLGVWRPGVSYHLPRTREDHLADQW